MHRSSSTQGNGANEFLHAIPYHLRTQYTAGDMSMVFVNVHPKKGTKKAKK